MKRHITFYFIGIMVVLIVAYDVWVILTGGIESSISHVLIEWSYEYPISVFALGVVCGHLFWRLRETKILAQKIGEKHDIPNH